MAVSGTKGNTDRMEEDWYLGLKTISKVSRHNLLVCDYENLFQFHRNSVSLLQIPSKLTLHLLFNFLHYIKGSKSFILFCIALSFI